MRENLGRVIAQERRDIAKLLRPDRPLRLLVLVVVDDVMRHHAILAGKGWELSADSASFGDQGVKWDLQHAEHFVAFLRRAVSNEKNAEFFLVVQKQVGFGSRKVAEKVTERRELFVN